MHRRFSLATLLLLAIVAIGLASAQTALARLAEQIAAALSDVDPWAIVPIAAIGLVIIAVYACWLGYWNGSGGLPLIAMVLGGMCLGAAAAVQLTVKTSRVVIVLAPLIIVVLTTFVAIHRRRATTRSAVHE